MKFTLRNGSSDLIPKKSSALLLPALLIFSIPVSAQEPTVVAKATVTKSVAAEITANTTTKPNSNLDDQSSIRDAERSAAKRIHAALAKRTELKWDKPLSEAMKDLSREFNILIELDQVALVDAGYGPDEPISVDGQGRTLFSTLKSAFTDLNLTFVVINEAMLVTTQDAIDAEPGKYLTLRVFNISKLEMSSDDVIRLIENQIDPQSWLETNGGPGTISPITKGDSELLVVSQTLLNHMKIEDLFEEIQSASSK